MSEMSERMSEAAFAEILGSEVDRPPLLRLPIPSVGELNIGREQFSRAGIQNVQRTCAIARANAVLAFVRHTDRHYSLSLFARAQGVRASS